jgi:hypothetical protein
LYKHSHFIVYHSSFRKVFISSPYFFKFHTKSKLIHLKYFFPTDDATFHNHQIIDQTTTVFASFCVNHSAERYSLETCVHIAFSAEYSLYSHIHNPACVQALRILNHGWLAKLSIAQNKYEFLNNFKFHSFNNQNDATEDAVENSTSVANSPRGTFSGTHVFSLRFFNHIHIAKESQKSSTLLCQLSSNAHTARIARSHVL